MLLKVTFYNAPASNPNEIFLSKRKVRKKEGEARGKKGGRDEGRKKNKDR